MEHHPSNDTYPKTLSFSSFVTGEEAGAGSFLQMPVRRQIKPSPRTAHREAAVEPIVVSPYDVDAYGQPRILSKWEVIFHALAWPAVIGVVIGFGLAVSLFAVQNPSTLQPQKKAGHAQVAPQELAP